LVEEVPFLESDEVGARVEEPVGVIDAKPVHLPGGEEAERENVRFLEDVQVLHPDRRQGVDVEEAPVVDLLPRHTPVGEPVGHVAVEELVQRVEAARVAVPVESGEVGAEVLGDHR
jgi:hypothetical protein